MVDVQGLRKPAGQSGPGNDTMRMERMHLVLPTRDLPPVPGPAVSLTVSIPCTSLPSFWAGTLLEEGLPIHSSVLFMLVGVQLYFLPSTEVPIAPDPASDPASEPWKTRFGKEMLAPVCRQGPISGRVAP